MAVLVETTIGDFVVDLYTEERPRTCLNFIKLCKTKKYNTCKFHSVEEGFIAQTGDPTGTGRGGSSIFEHLYGEQARYFEMEMIPKLNHATAGTLSMVNNGDDMNGSQFFLTLGDKHTYLDGKHTVFGFVAEGQEILEKLNAAICDEDHVPYQDIWITHTVVLHDPFDDPKGLTVQSRSPSPDWDALIRQSRIAPGEELDEDANKSLDQIQLRIEQKEAKARAHILEMIGDLHHADERPPDNVLFVCKLNPVTTDEDLAIIFSRFGTIVECEIIRDKKTGNSLQYAFIEFESPQMCENAYFKMDNVLIDDRRIHVDFSQSVSKNYQWKEQVPATDKRTETKRKRSKSPDRSKKRRSPAPEKRRRSPERDRKRPKESDRRRRSRSRDRRSRSRDRHDKSRDRDRRTNHRDRDRKERKHKRSRSRSHGKKKHRKRASS